MNRDYIAIFENENHEVYAVTDDSAIEYDYTTRLVEADFKYYIKKCGIARIYTVYKD